MQAYLRWIGLLIGITVVGCATLKEAPIEGQGWPLTESREVRLSESEYVDLGLRIMALEMTQSGDGQVKYYGAFYPRLGKVEFICLFRSAPLTFQSSGKEPGIPRNLWELRLNTEVDRIRAGVKDLFADLAVGKGYDAQKHLEIHFQMNQAEIKEFAVFRQGQVNWLTLPEKASSSP